LSRSANQPQTDSIVRKDIAEKRSEKFREMLQAGFVPISSMRAGKRVQTWSRREYCVQDGEHWLKVIDYCIKHLGGDAVNKEIRKLLGERSVADLLGDGELAQQYEHLLTVMVEAAELAKKA